MGYNKMKQLMECLDNEILLTLVDTSNGFDKALDEDHSTPSQHDRMLIKLELMARCCNCESAPVNMVHFLKMVNSSASVKNSYLSNFVMETTNNPEIPLQRYSEGLVNLLTLVKTFYIRMPNSDFVNKARLTLLAIEQLMTEQSRIVTEDLQILFTEIQSLKAQNQATNETRRQPVNEEMNDEDDQLQPPNDFREMSIVPSIDDINRNEETFLRANKAKGKYEDLNHYLDVQFRLLREDFVHPLRAGILSYQEIKNGGLPPGTKMTDVRIYEDVHILGPVCSGQGLAYRIKFDNSSTKKIKWENSKRLIYGSLIALSSNDFTTMYLCSVVNRNPRDLAKGILEVQVEQDVDEFALLGPDISFTMAETTAYFESFRHVLAALKEVIPEEFPFQRYIVRCHKAIAVPRYLQRHGEIKFDFRPLFPKDEDDSNASSRQKFRDVTLLDLEDWPTAKHLHLDGSQYEALQHCLTREFSLVQGPPGTGKTFLGLKVMQLLLHNWDKWNLNPDAEHQEPILVVCYTNHALDQFLEGIKSFSDKQIVRVGSRSQSELLKDCSLNNIRNDMKRNRRVSVALHSAFRRLQNDMNDLQEQILTSTCVIEGMDENIMQLDRLREVILDDHVAQLQDFYYSKNDPLIAWLNGEDLLMYPNHNEWQQNEDMDGNLENNFAALQIDEWDPQVGLEDEEVDEDERRRILEDDTDNAEDGKKKDDSRHKIMQEVRQAYFVEQEHQHHPGVQGAAGWQTQGKSKKKNRKKLIRLQKNVNVTPMTFEEVQFVYDIFTLPLQERHRLYKYWKEAYMRIIRQKCRSHEEIYHQKSAQLKEARHQLDKEIMQTGVIIGMTTTAAARYHLVLQEIRPRIVIVEEAAEVLEAHVITALSRNCEHLMLIGDHKQLRPSPNVFELATKYNLDLSLFERMVNNGIPIRTLELQHRMRPLISKFMKPIYSKLSDDPSVHEYSHVKGIEKDMYFINHNHAEETQDEASSKVNTFEAQYIEKLCKYLLMQDYNPSRITILTPYSGQMFELKKSMRDSCKGVRITVVDNFQGEENDIIILSLVRSNKNGKLGFLKIENRVCVALSRAKVGFYVLGNINFLADHSKIWLEMKKIAERENIISPALTLVCQQHPDSKIRAGKPKDFDEAPEGGCMLPCSTRLTCGHVCPRPCHSYDPQHENIKCNKPCTKLLCEEHRCTKKCSEPCGQCMVLVQKTVPSCNHEAFMACHKDPSTWLCTNPCKKNLRGCGHQCVNNCGDICVKYCQVSVKQKLPCGHVCEMKCCDDPKTFSCTNPCEKILTCEHKCTGSCGACHQGRLHQGCRSPCGRILICGHECEAPCSEACPPCKKKCDTKCQHSKCSKVCGELCTPCKEPCQWRCKHHKCSKLCSEPCDRPVCNEPCERKLRGCEHPCIGLCGEICPKLCRTCNKDLVEEIFFGTEDEADARFIVLDCSHIMEVEGMDIWMTSGHTANEIILKTCPKCKTPIRKTLRYKSAIMAVLADIEGVKANVLGDANRNLKSVQLSELFNYELRKEAFEGFAMSLLKQLEDKCRPPLNMEHYDETDDIRFSRVLRKLTLSLNELTSLHNLMNFAIGLEKVCKKLKEGEKDFLPNGCQDIIDFFEVLRRTLQSWLLKMIRSFSRLSQQQCKEFGQELCRLQMAVKLCRVKTNVNKYSNRNLSAVEAAEANAAIKVIDNLFEVLQSNKPFDDVRKERCDSSIKAVASKFPGGGLGISADEKIQIVNAMGLSTGHWYKCPKGHIYAIGECGGATVESTCPECGARIGGSGHRLRSDNQLASEMDGATRPAWPTALM